MDRTREDIRKELRMTLDQGLCTESQNDAWGLINELIEIKMDSVKLFVKDMALGMTGLVNIAFGVLGLSSGEPFFQVVGGLSS